MRFSSDLNFARLFSEKLELKLFFHGQRSGKARPNPLSDSKIIHIDCLQLTLTRVSQINFAIKHQIYPVQLFYVSPTISRFSSKKKTFSYVSLVMRSGSVNES